LCCVVKNFRNSLVVPNVRNILIEDWLQRKYYSWFSHTWLDVLLLRVVAIGTTTEARVR
jgi:hypothetical protein